MTKSELIECLETMPREFGDPEVFIEYDIKGERFLEPIGDLMGNEKRFILITEKALACDPLSQVRTGVLQ